MTSYKTTKAPALLLALLTLAPLYNDAVAVDQFFNNDDSTQYNKKELVGSNRESDNPIVTINTFKTENLFKETLEGIKQSDIEDIINKHQKEHNNRYTIDRLTHLTDQLTNYYRSKGYILAKVYLPKQDIRNRSLNLEVVFGKLEKVSTYNQDHYSAERLERPFKGIIGKPVTVASLESTLLELNQYPGVKVKSRFREGDDIGGTQIDVHVQHEKISDFNFRFDNYGSEYTGSMRGTLTGYFYNLADMADQLSFNLLATVNPTNSLFWGVNYKTLWSPYFESETLNKLFQYGFFTEVGYQQSQYDIGGEFEPLGIEGKVKSTYVKLSKQFILTNDFKLTSGLKISKKDASSTNQIGNKDITDKISSATINLDIQWNDHFLSPSVNAIFFTISKGLPGFAGSYENNDSDISRTATDKNGVIIEYGAMDFEKYNLVAMRKQKIGPYQLLTKANWQYTNDLLVAPEQFSVGGAQSVRGYTSSDYSADRASIYTVEVSGKSSALKFSLPISDLKLAGFIDYGFGKRLKPDANTEGDIEMASIGGYAQFLKEGKFSSKIELAIPLLEIGENKKSNFEILFNFDRGF